MADLDAKVDEKDPLYALVQCVCGREVRALVRDDVVPNDQWVQCVCGARLSVGTSAAPIPLVPSLLEKIIEQCAGGVSLQVRRYYGDHAVGASEYSLLYYRSAARNALGRQVRGATLAEVLAEAVKWLDKEQQ